MISHKFIKQRHSDADVLRCPKEVSVKRELNVFKLNVFKFRKVNSSYKNIQPKAGESGQARSYVAIGITKICR